MNFIGHYGLVEPRHLTPQRFKRFAQAYKAMAKRARYRPEGPSDGVGGLYLTDEELLDPTRLEREAERYALRFAGEDDSRHFFVGVSNYSTNRALVYAIEAARSLCGCQPELAADLLRMALKEIEATTKKAA